MNKINRVPNSSTEWEVAFESHQREGGDQQGSTDAPREEWVWLQVVREQPGSHGGDLRAACQGGSRCPWKGL